MRASELATGLDDHLTTAVKQWMEGSWPFERVAYSGRDISWADFEALPD